MSKLYLKLVGTGVDGVKGSVECLVDGIEDLTEAQFQEVVDGSLPAFDQIFLHNSLTGEDFLLASV